MYKLLRIETGAKVGAHYHYKVIETATGRRVSERYSNRRYVAATIDGRFYFSRTDLVGKNAHGRHNAWRKKTMGMDPVPVAYVEN